MIARAPGIGPKVAQRIVSEGLSVREAETLSQRTLAAARKPAREPVVKDSDTAALEKRLSDLLGLHVAIDHKDQGGRLEIRYRTLEQLDSLCARLTSG